MRGNSHQLVAMPTATPRRSKATEGISIVQHYDIAADAKNRISLRGATAKYFHVQALSNGSYVLQPRVLVSPDSISAIENAGELGCPTEEGQSLCTD